MRQLPTKILIGQPARVLVLAVLPAGFAAYFATWLPWPPLAQAAAGLAAGLICAAGLSAAIGPLRRELFPLVQVVGRAARREPR